MDQKALTKRQAEFLAKSARGMTYEEIAKTSFVTKNTVRSTFTSARKRLGAETNTQCVVMAIAREELGLSHDGICFVPDYEEK
jgi:DNA-binding NarL/FixJ family response regulator